MHLYGGGQPARMERATIYRGRMDKKALLGASKWHDAAAYCRLLVFEDAVADGFTQDGVARNHIRTQCREVVEHT